MNLGHLPVINAEPSGLREVLLNLIYNALDAMPEGGRLTLSTRVVGDHEVEIEVADTGYGMTPEVAARIFDPFFTTRGVEGTGLGLAVSWTIIQRHGGAIVVESLPEQGARFFLRLPVGGAEPREERRSVAGVTPAPAGTPLLVVDDEAFVAGVLSTILTRSGYHVTVVHSAEEALERLNSAEVAYRLVITDHGMPGMNGLQLIAAIKQRWPEMPTVLLTGWGESVLQTHITETLPDALLGKPIHQADLLAAIAKALHNSSPAQPSDETHPIGNSEQSE